MGPNGFERQPPAPSAAPISAFDFDGTLTIEDSFLAFLRWRRGPAAFLLALPRLIPDVLAFLFRPDVERLKAAAVRVYLGGSPAAAVAAEAEAFATARFARLMRPDGLAAVAAARAAGERVVIVTASPELVVAAFGRRLGVDEVIGTRLRTDGGGRLTGALDGPNCRGPEKVARLRARFGADVRLKAAYGDTSGDVEMLGIADQPHMRLFTGRPARGGG